MATIIEFNKISKQYRLGQVSTRMLSHDLKRWWYTSILRKEDPYLKIGSINDRTTAADSEYVWALKDIDFKVEQGDVVGIIGRNGSGKSTLLKILSRVTGPTTGNIRSKGRIGSLLEVGTGFHPEMTGRENIYLNGAILGMTKNDISRKLDEIVDFSGCERYLDTPVKRYSSGMMVRLGFAVAAHLEPEILVVDEVLAVGDAEFQKKAVGKIKEVSGNEGRTVLFVSHNMGSIKSLCTRGVLLKNGMIDYMGDIDNTLEAYMKQRIAKGQDIVSLTKYYDNHITLHSIQVNGSFTNLITFPSGEPTVEISILGHLNAPLKLSLEVVISDILDEPVIVYSSHHHDSPLIPAGEFEITKKFTLPKGLMNGDYVANIFLVNSGETNYVEIPGAFMFTTYNCYSSSGLEVHYSSGGSHIFIE